MIYYRILNIVPCAIQWDLVVCLFYIEYFVYANLKLLIYPSLTPFPLWYLFGLFCKSVFMDYFFLIE